MDDADPPLARSLEPLHDSVAGTHAGLGKSCAMTTRNASTSMGRRRDTLPLQPTQKQNLTVYTEELTHLNPIGENADHPVSNVRLSDGTLQ